MMDIIIALLGALTGGGLTGLFAWKANQRKANGEATQTEADAMKSWQDVYQQTLDDQLKYINQLRETRDHLIDDREEMRRENNELRKRLNDMDEKVRQLERDVDNNRKMVISLKPFLCGLPGCPNRTPVDLSKSEDGNQAVAVTVKQPRKTTKK